MESLEIEWAVLASSWAVRRAVIHRLEIGPLLVPQISHQGIVVEMLTRVVFNHDLISLVLF